MKIRLSLICMVVCLATMNVADAQLLDNPQAGAFLPGGGGLASGGQSAFRQVRGEVQSGLPGRFWFETNLADEGLGYNGSYLTLGGKRRLFEDFLDGRWLFEAQLHHSIDEDEGDFFTNFGIERVFSIPAAGADVSLGGWYDYNDQTDAPFSNAFHQVGISGSIKSRRWDLLANGYFPVGDTDGTFGDPTGVIPFARNSILSEAAIDAAQTGFDVTMRFRPKQLAFVNGTVDLGGYGYRSDEIEFFGGGRVRLGFQALRGAIISAEVNHDDRFNTTGVLSIAWLFGANGGVGGEYAGIGRDLEATQRNDHVVRVSTEASFVINPLTGEPYNVLHVNNLGGIEGSGEGTFEQPFLTLAEAEAAGAENDVIFVGTGDGSPRNLNTGIALQNGQSLLGDGGTYSIPNAATGGDFQLITGGGPGPFISNPGGSSVVELAGNNGIAGVTIDGTGATNGINGANVSNLVVEDVIVQNSGQNGLRLDSFSGLLDIQDSTFTGNGASGLLVENLTDSTSSILLDNNTATFNGLDGFRFQDFDPDTFILNDNTTSNNVGNGLTLTNFANTATNGLNILNHIADSNVGAGIDIDNGNGKLNILIPNITNNAGGGILITDFTNVPGDFTVISGVAGNQANITGNGNGPNNVDIELTQPGLLQNVLISEAVIANGNGVGIRAAATGLGTVMNLDIRDNVAVTGNFSNGITVSAFDSATINAVIGNPDNPLPDVLVSGNGAIGASGIALLAQGNTGATTPSRLNAALTNIQVQNADDLLINGMPQDAVGDGVDITSTGNAVVDVSIVDSNIGAPAGNVAPDLSVFHGVDIALTNLGLLDPVTGDELINNIFLDNLNLVVGESDGTGANSASGVNIVSGPTTLSNIVVQNSTINPNANQTTGAPADNSVFGDTVGFEGITANYTGAGVAVPGFLTGPGNLFDGTGGTNALNGQGIILTAQTSDGVIDSLSQLTIRNNVIRDFTFNGINIATRGDAQLLLDISSNQIANNGAGTDSDTDGDNVFGEPFQPGGAGTPSINTLLFFDGINIDAFDESQISARIVGNLIQDNFEAGLSINTFQGATINALVEANAFDGNDRGQAAGVLSPLTSVGGPRPGVATGGNFSIELINNEEFFFRAFESPVFTIQDGSGNDGLLLDVTMLPMQVPLMLMGAPGTPIPGNVGGFDMNGTPVPFGTATLNVVLNNNAIDLGVLVGDFSVPPGLFSLGLAGSNAGFATTPPGMPPNISVPPALTTLGAVDALIQADEADFQLRGF